MIGFKVLTKDGLKGPFKKSSILKAITAAQIPLQARLLDLETGRYLSAAELVGESVDHGLAPGLREPQPAQRHSKGAKPTPKADKKEAGQITSISEFIIDDGKLRLDEDAGDKE